ncbi:MAG: T9SS type A sorting domain-containing protein [Bacteroidales bacterium]|nr:T9SS type A sorting domain-containing protein [Bacteroidales bacterium]
MRKSKLKFLILIGLLNISIILNATTFTVINTNDFGNGSLRNALQMLVLSPGPHTINFNIPLSDPNYNSSLGIWVISPLSTFDYIITSNITIDGTSQTANQGDTNPFGPEIYLNGNNNSINFCFSIINASGTVIKGFTISNFMYGIQIYGTSSVNSIITGNYIGTNATATDTAGNYIGIEIIAGANYTTIGGTSIAERNIISGNEHIGIRLLDVSHCTVIGNYVGVDRTGTNALRNYDGISLESAAKFNTIGGTNANERNIVSGNVAYGIPVFGAGAEGNIIIGNYIGTDITGTIAIPNTYGVLFDDGSYGNILGGSSTSERNIISGNSAYGVFIYNMGTNSNIVKNNYIGTNAEGTAAIPNAVGVVVDGAAFKHKIDNNIISGNLQQGIYINITGSDSTLITKNKIGVNIDNNPLGNGSDGICISQGPRYSIIGGSVADANIIAHNEGNGVYIMFPDDDFHLISYNSIYSNGGLGIDLFPPGVNANDIGDLDTGPNEGMNYPEIDTVIFISELNKTIISGFLDTQNPELCTIQIFKAIPDPSGHGQGSEYLSTTMPDVQGNWNDTLFGLTASDFLTCIAIDQNNNTSEFSITRNTTTIVAINDYQKDKNIKIYPNPFTGKFVIETIMMDDAIIEIFNIAGEKVFQSKILNPQFEINLNVARGIYFYQIKDKQQFISSGKLILQ